MRFGYKDIFSLLILSIFPSALVYYCSNCWFMLWFLCQSVELVDTGHRAKRAVYVKMAIKRLPVLVEELNIL